jgi:hypothetical protein
MIEADTVAEALFEKIRARFEKVSVGDENAKATTEPSKARIFSFDYIAKDGENFGNVTISIADEQALKLFFGKNLTAELDEVQKIEWYDFLRDIRMFSRRNLLSFDARDISRNNLEVKDLKYLTKNNSIETTGETQVAEGKMYGSTKTSYAPVSKNTRLIIRHTGSVDESVHGARSRKIQAIYVEDGDGQRLKVPHTHLGGAKALGMHIANGGQINDDFGKYTTDLVQEMAKMRKFIQGSRNKTFEDHEATDMVQAAKERYHTIHHILHKISGNRGYHVFKETWAPETDQSDVDLDTMRSKFTQKNFDPRLEDALPHVHKAYNTMKKTTIESQIDEFAENLDKLEEGTWAIPEDDMKMQELQELMSNVLVAGVDGQDASAALYDILGDDDLFDRIYDASQGSPDMDVRPIVYDWLMANMPSIGKRIEANMGQGGEEQMQQPQPDAEAQPEPQQNQSDEQQQQQESIERDTAALAEMRRLAGLY